MEQQTFDLLLLTMSALAVVVFAALYYVRAGYGMFQTSKWGISLNNKLGWILMEAPVFFVMLYLWWNSSVRCSAVPLVFFLLFELHYFQRAFIFPFLMSFKPGSLRRQVQTADAGKQAHMGQFIHGPSAHGTVRSHFPAPQGPPPYPP